MKVTYERTPAVTDLRRAYCITVALSPGYNQQQPWSRDAVVAEHGRWMRLRIAAAQPYLTGVVTDCVISYAYPRPEPDNEELQPVVVTEPGVQLCGEVSVLYAAQVPDDAVVDMLDELAGVLAAATGQQRVYVRYRDRVWCLDRHERHP